MDEQANAILLRRRIDEAEAKLSQLIKSIRRNPEATCCAIEYRYHRGVRDGLAEAYRIVTGKD